MIEPLPVINPLRLANAIRDQADDYGTKVNKVVGASTSAMYGTASLVLYALSIALLESLQPVLHDLAQKEHDDAPPSN